MPGYPIELFIQPPSQNFICSICTDVCCDPVQCQNEHGFCRDCIQEAILHSKYCPECRAPLNPNNLRASRLRKNEIENLIIRCKNYQQNNSFSCKWTGKVDEFENHLQSCKISATLPSAPVLPPPPPPPPPPRPIQTQSQPPIRTSTTTTTTTTTNNSNNSTLSTAQINELISLFESDSYLQFLEKYRQIVTPINETDQLLTVKGISYLRIGEYENSIQCFNLLLQKNPNNKEANVYKTSAANLWVQSCLQKGNQLFNSGDMLEACEAYTQANLNDLSSIVDKNLIFHLCNNYAIALSNSGRNIEALRAFSSPFLIKSLEEEDDIVLSNKRHSENAYHKATLLQNLDRYDEALSEFDLCLSFESDNLTAISGKCDLLTNIGRCEEALHILTNAINLFPLNETYNYYSNSNDSDESDNGIKKIKKIISLWLSRGYTSLKLNLYQNAIDDFSYIVSLLSTPPLSTMIPQEDTLMKESKRLRNICLNYYAESLLQSGEVLLAIRTYNEAIELMGGVEETSINILSNRAYAYYQITSNTNLNINSMEYLDKAIESFELIIHRDSSFSAAYVGLGQALLKKANLMSEDNKNQDEQDIFSNKDNPILLSAIEAFKQAHALDPNDTQVLHNLAITLLRTKQPEAAASKFRLLLQLSPDSDVAEKGLSLSEQLIVENTKAEELRKTNSQNNNNNNNNNSSSTFLSTRQSNTTSTTTATSEKPSGSLKEETKSSSSSSNNSQLKSSNNTSKLSFSSSTSSNKTQSSLKSNYNSSPSPAPAPAPAPTQSSTQSSKSTNVVELLNYIRSHSTYHPLSSLKSPGPYPEGVDPSHRELYLPEDTFYELFSSTKEEFLSFPSWKQVSKKKGLSLF